MEEMGAKADWLVSWLPRGGCAAALELLKKVAERGPWAAGLQDAFEWVSTSFCLHAYSWCPSKSSIIL